MTIIIINVISTLTNSERATDYSNPEKPRCGYQAARYSPLWSMREHLSIILKAEIIRISIHRLFVLDVRSTIVKKIDTVPALQSL